MFGIFSLLSALASCARLTPASMVLATIGSLARAWLFASLVLRMSAHGGPYGYARVAFGNRLCFANAWSYWITAWAGNAAIAVTGVPTVPPPISLLQERDAVVALASALIQHPRTWEASGHLAGFTDPLIDCRTCKLRFRADHLEV